MFNFCWLVWTLRAISCSTEIGHLLLCPILILIILCHWCLRKYTTPYLNPIMLCFRLNPILHFPHLFLAHRLILEVGLFMFTNQHLLFFHSLLVSLSLSKWPNPSKIIYSFHQRPTKNVHFQSDLYTYEWIWTKKKHSLWHTLFVAFHPKLLISLFCRALYSQLWSRKSASSYSFNVLLSSNIDLLLFFSLKFKVLHSYGVTFIMWW